MKIFTALVLVCGTAWVASACQEACACPPIPYVAVAYGSVRLSSGEALPNAVVYAFSAPAVGCHADVGSVYDTARSADDGSYALSLLSAGAQDSTCVFVYAIPPSGAPSLLTSDTTLVLVDFRSEGSVDSALVDPIIPLP